LRIRTWRKSMLLRTASYHACFGKMASFACVFHKSARNGPFARCRPRIGTACTAQRHVPGIRRACNSSCGLVFPCWLTPYSNRTLTFGDLAGMDSFASGGAAGRGGVRRELAVQSGGWRALPLLSIEVLFMPSLLPPRLPRSG